MLADARAKQALATPIDRSKYETIQSLERLDQWIADAFAAGVVALDTETTSLDAMSCDLVGVSLALEPDRACYIPLGHLAPGAQDLFGGAGLAPGQIPLAAAIERLKPLLEDAATLKIAHNMKYDLQVLSRHGVNVAPLEDTMLISYALDTGRNNHGLDELALKHLGHKNIAFGEVAGTGRNFIGFARVALDKATEYAAEDADVCLRLWRVLKPRLVAERMTNVYETLERPMVATLAAMERRGVAIDRTILSRLSGEFAQAMARLEGEIHAAAGERFNLGSPKQLGDILFGKMGLPGAKKTATGAWSTSASVLDELAEGGNAFAALILEWRQLSKLKSTYSDALPGFVNPRNAPRPHILRAGRDDDRTALLLGAEFAKYSGAQRNGAQDPRGLRRRGRTRVDLGGLFADRAAAARACRGYSAAQKGLRLGARHSRDDRQRNVRRSRGGHALRGAAPRQGD